MYLEDLAVLLIWLVVTVLQVNFALACFILFRRFQRKRYFLVKDAAREHFRPTIEAFAESRMSLENAVADLGPVVKPAEREALTESVATHIRRRNADDFSELLFALGMVDELACKAFGRKRAGQLVKLALSGDLPTGNQRPSSRLVRRLRNTKGRSIPRAIALRQLAELSPKYASPMLVAGLSDDALEVRRAAIWGLGRIRRPNTYELLFQELDRTFERGADLPTQYVLSGLGRMDVPDLDALLPWIRSGRAETRAALIAFADRICGRRDRNSYVNRNDFSKELYDLFLDKLTQEPLPGIRAAAAGVVRYFRDGRAAASLSVLIRDEDAEVRQKALSCCGEMTYVRLLPFVMEAVGSTDAATRRAAIRATLAFGSEGLRALLEELCATLSDETVAEIAEGIGMSGNMTDVLRTAVQERGESSPAYRALQRLAELGKTSFLTYSMLSYSEPMVRLKLIDILAGAPGTDVEDALKVVAETTAGPVQEKAGAVLVGRESMGA